MPDNQVHSPIGASSMYRWEKCPGSIRMSKDMPNIESDYARIGTIAHEVAAEYLSNKTWPLNDENVTEEMLEAVRVYTDLIETDFSKALHSESFILIEHKFDMSALYPGLYGTSDCVIFDGNTKTLRVYDYKHGAGLPVEVEDNPQLKYYALGALLSSKAKATTVEMIIVQPRCYHGRGPIRRTEIPAVDLIEFSADLIEAAEKTKDPNAPLVPGSHCKFCNASGVCPALHGQALALAKEEFKPSLSYNPEKLSEALSKIEVVESWIKGVRDFAYNEAVHGRIPPGWKLVEKRATRKWIENESLTDQIKQKFDLKDEDVFVKTFKSPAQIEKLFGKDKSKKEKLGSFVVSQSSGTVLVPESDNRPPALTSASDDFSVVKT